MESERVIYRRKLETEIRRWNLKLGVLRARAASSSMMRRSTRTRQIDELRHLQEAAERHLTQFDSAVEGITDGARAKLDKEWSRLSAAVEEVWRRVK